MHAALQCSPRARRSAVIVLVLALPAVFLPALIVPLVTGTILGSPPGLTPSRITLAMLSGAAVGLPGPLAMAFLARRFFASEIARFIVGAGACASCDYPLAGVPEDDDGCTVCPECRAAWRRETRATGRRSAGR